MRKGITPIISIIILLLITVALAGTAWTYMSGFMGTYTEKSFVVPTGGAYCDSSGTFHVRVVNTGTTAILTDDWTNAEVTNNTVTIKLVSSSVTTKGNADFTNTTANGKGQAGKSYTVIIGTVAGIQRIPVVCP